ncbi:MFS transporter [Sporomusa malonica]|uniref:Predicted arabinose efflux permease, MFS family n=1 Tax=Sporomusa malonica TaxID=112901 RepID=A0A1W2E6Y3_9FIRM|nr:MFS transporter [Sporomusa malonica]SMD05405.1 Predicted arabinose efflux permease, MFS family [Sporomusa malonica]
MLRDNTLLGLIVAVVLMMVGVGMVMPQLPQRVVDFDGNGRSVGYIASAFAFSYLLLQVPSGRVADRIGFKPLLVFGYLLCSLTGLVFYYAASSYMIFFARLLQGIGEAPVWALAPALLSLRFPLIKGKVMGIYSAAMHSGLALGPILGVVLVKIVNSNAVFLVYSVGCLAGAIAIYLLVDNSSKQEYQAMSKFDIPAVLRLIRHRKTLLALSGITLYGAAYGIFHTNIPVFLVEEKNFTPVQIGMFFSLFYVAISLSQIIIGPMSDRFGRNIFMILGLVTVAGGFIVMPAYCFPLILLVLTVVSFGMGVFCLASMAYLNETVPGSLKGTISGAYYLFWGSGYFFGPLLIIQAADLIDFQAAMTGYSTLVLLVAIGLIMISGAKKA